jgi:heptosyltransferase-2
VSDRILVRAPNWIGDVVLSLAAVRDVRRNFPQARLEVLARPWVAELYQAIGEVDAVREAGRFRGDVESLRGASFDTAILLTNSFGTALQVWLAGIPERWGYATELRSALLTRRARVPGSLSGESEVYYYRAMLAGVGLRVSAEPDTSLACRPEWAERAQTLLPGGRWVGINPGAAFGSAKRWLPERYSALADRIMRKAGARVVLLGAAADRPVAEAIARGMSEAPTILCGRTGLGDLAGVLRRLALLVTNDSGPMHLASALGVPVAALFGPTDWRETAPRGPHRLLREPVPCAPCKLRACPVDHRCMRLVAVDRVERECLEMLEAA